MFSVSTIYSAKDFLDFIKANNISATEFINSFGKYQYDSAPKVLKLVTECGWSRLTTEGCLVLTEHGETITSLNYKEALQIQLEDMILRYNPEWASLLPKGREETLPFLNDNVSQCFKEAGFSGILTDDLIYQWDRLSLAYRNYNQKLLLETGRLGEKLSMLYEAVRTKLDPIWQSVESNLSGYDILSVVDTNIKGKLLIEVKTSISKAEYANFFLSRNEWITAQSSLNYIFHLWLISDIAQVYVVDKKIISQHVPDNNGDGDWQSCKIPFLSVIDKNNPVYVFGNFNDSDSVKKFNYHL